MKIALPLILLVLAWVIWRARHTGPMPVPGAAAPDFRLFDQHGGTHRLSDYAGRWLVLYFYPKDDTPGCTREACVFRDGLAKLEAVGAAVVGVSVDTLASHARFAEKYQLNFPLLADADGTVPRRYGTLMDWLFLRMAKRVTFLVDPKGQVRRVYRRVDPTVHADEIIAALSGSAQ